MLGTQTLPVTPGPIAGRELRAPASLERSELATLSGSAGAPEASSFGWIGAFKK